MKNLVKILGIITVVLLLGGMFTACPHSEIGLGGATPDKEASALTANASSSKGTGGGGGGGGSEELTDELAAFKEELLAEYDDLNAAEKTVMELMFKGAGLPVNPHNWTDSQWKKAFDTLSELVDQGASDEASDESGH